MRDQIVQRGEWLDMSLSLMEGTDPTAIRTIALGLASRLPNGRPTTEASLLTHSTGSRKAHDMRNEFAEILQPMFKGARSRNRDGE